MERTSETRKEKLITPSLVMTSAAASGAFYVFMTVMLRPFVFAETAWKVWFGAAFTAIPLTGTFFLAVAMFLLVLRDQRLRAQGIEVEHD
jgi:hypothetical protein